VERFTNSSTMKTLKQLN